MYRITKAWTFSAAHHLPTLPETHKCHRPHGHNYRVTLTLAGMELDAHGMVVDYGALAPFGDTIRDQLDHRDLNDLMEQPTAEVLAERLFSLAESLFPEFVVACEVRETDGTSAEYRP